MPPPKKPKNGPTTVEQFLSQEELQVLGKSRRSAKKETGGSARISSKSQGEGRDQTSPESHQPQHPPHGRNVPLEASASYDGRHNLQVSMAHSIGQSLVTESNSSKFVSEGHPGSAAGRNPPRLLHASCLVSTSAPSFHSSESNTGSFVFNRPSRAAAAAPERDALEEAFSTRPVERLLLENLSSLHEGRSWPSDLSPAPVAQKKQHHHPTLSEESSLASLGYRLTTTSNTLTSLVTRPTGLPPSLTLGPPHHGSLHVNLSPNSSVVDLQSLSPAASFVSLQHHRTQHQQQHRHQLPLQQKAQQNLDGNARLSSLPNTSMSIMLSPRNEEFLLQASSSGLSRGEGGASTYLNSLMRQPLCQQLCEPSPSVLITSTQCSESTVYLRSAFQLPPPTTSAGVRASTNITSPLTLASPSLGSAGPPGLPRHLNAKTQLSPHNTSPRKPSQGQIPTSPFSSSSSLGSISRDSNSSNAGSISRGSSNSSSAGSLNGGGASLLLHPHHGSNHKDDARLLDLSVKSRRPLDVRNRHTLDLFKHRHLDEVATVVFQDNPSPRLPTLVAAYTEDPGLQSSSDTGQYSGSVLPQGPPDGSDSYLRVVNSNPSRSLVRELSKPASPMPDVSRAPTSRKLAGLLASDLDVLKSTSSPPLIKHEVICNTTSRSPAGSTATDRDGRDSDTDDRETPDSKKSLREELLLASPASSLTSAPGRDGPGEGNGPGSAHLQAATSTTSDPGSAPNEFLQGPEQASSSLHLKQELASGSSVPGSSVQARLCQVCHDNASGFHYGVWSCEGCKAFFKRSIQGPVDYICPATNTCTIDKHRRKSCQACRLRRCYEVGMNKGSQRKERKTPASTPGFKGKRCRADSSETAVNSTNCGLSSVKVAKRSKSVSILEALQKADLPVLESYHNHNLPATPTHLLNTLIKLADRELVYLINWAKHVPGYTCLTLSDQVHLIECCWMELLLLNCAFRSMEFEGQTLVFAPDFHLNRQQWPLTGMSDVLELVSAVSEQMVLHGLNKEELLLLQATILVNAEVRHMDSFVKIQDMKQLILDVFMEVASRHQGFGNLQHAPSILLLLTHIRQAGERSISHFQRLKQEGCITFCDLLTEMLDAHVAFRESQQIGRTNQNKYLSKTLQQQTTHHSYHSVTPD